MRCLFVCPHLAFQLTEYVLTANHRFLLFKAVAEARLGLLEDAGVFKQWVSLLSQVNQNVVSLAQDDNQTKPTPDRIVDAMFSAVPERLLLEIVQILIDRVQADFHDNAATLLSLSAFLQTGSTEGSARARRCVSFLLFLAKDSFPQIIKKINNNRSSV